jgi:hypothetical protein
MSSWGWFVDTFKVGGSKTLLFYTPQSSLAAMLVDNSLCFTTLFYHFFQTTFHKKSLPFLSVKLNVLPIFNNPYKDNNKLINYIII